MYMDIEYMNRVNRLLLLRRLFSIPVCDLFCIFLRDTFGKGKTKSTLKFSTISHAFNFDKTKKRRCTQGITQFNFKKMEKVRVSRESGTEKRRNKKRKTMGKGLSTI